MQQDSIYEKILCFSFKRRTFLEFPNFLRNQESEDNPPDRPSQNHHRPQHISSLKEEDEKETMKHFKDVIKICPNRRHILRNKLWNTQMALPKISALSRHLVRTYSMQLGSRAEAIQKHMSRKRYNRFYLWVHSYRYNNYVPLAVWNGSALTVNQKQMQRTKRKRDMTR